MGLSFRHVFQRRLSKLNQTPGEQHRDKQRQRKAENQSTTLQYGLSVPAAYPQAKSKPREHHQRSDERCEHPPTDNEKQGLLPHPARFSSAFCVRPENIISPIVFLHAPTISTSSPPGIARFDDILCPTIPAPSINHAHTNTECNTITNRATAKRSPQAIPPPLPATTAQKQPTTPG